jgi:hypothetical protein
MMFAILFSMALAGEPPQPPCRYYEVLWAQSGAILRDTVDEHLCKVVVVDRKGDTLVVANEFTEITPDVYRATHKIDATAQKI